MALGTDTSDTVVRHRLAFNVDIAAIGLALVFAALVRFNIIPPIGW